MTRKNPTTLKMSAGAAVLAAAVLAVPLLLLPAGAASAAQMPATAKSQGVSGLFKGWVHSQDKALKAKSRGVGETLDDERTALLSREESNHDAFRADRGLADHLTEEHEALLRDRARQQAGD